MMKDKALEELFLANRPTFDDKDRFMELLTYKLDAIEYLCQYEKASIRRYKYAMAVAFALGIVVGSIMLLFILSMPNDTPLIVFNTASGMLLSIEQHSRIIASTGLMVLLGWGIVSIINNILDITQMKMSIRTKKKSEKFALKCNFSAQRLS